MQWVGEQLSDLGALLERAGVSGDGSFAADAESLRAAVPEITAVVRALLDRVKAGELAMAPAGDEPESAGSAGCNARRSRGRLAADLATAVCRVGRANPPFGAYWCRRLG